MRNKRRMDSDTRKDYLHMKKMLCVEKNQISTIKKSIKYYEEQIKEIEEKFEV